MAAKWFNSLMVSAMMAVLVSSSARAQVTLPDGTIVPRNKMIVFILIGHSNMSGRHNPSDQTPHPRGWAYGANNRRQWEPVKDTVFENCSGAGPAIGFVKELLGAYGGSDPDLHVGIVQNAASAIKAVHYHSGTSRFNAVIDRCKEIRDQVTFGGIMTMLGLIERTNHTERERFAQDLSKAITDIRSALGLTPEQLPAYIQDYEMESCAEGAHDCGGRDFRASCPGAQVIISQLRQVPSLIGSAAIIPTDGIPTPDQCHHFSREGFREFGRRCVAAAQREEWDQIWNRVDREPPTVPANLAAGRITDRSVELSWTASTDDVGVKEYVVTWSPAEGSATVPAPSTSTTVTGLQPSTSYTFSVEARDLSGKVSGKSVPLTVTTNAADTEPPTAPTGLEVTGSTNTSVALNWGAATDNLGVAGYRVFTGTQQVSQTEQTSVTVSSGLVGGETYTFTVRAYDHAGNVGPASNSVTVTLPDRALVPIPFRVNVGGGVVADYAADQPWTNDAAYGYTGQGTEVAQGTSPVEGTSLDLVFQSVRHKNMGYRMGVPNGSYDVSLLLCEFWRDNPASGGSNYRTFRATIEGEPVVPDPIDVVAAVGKNTALILTTTVTVTDGYIDIALSDGNGGDPILSGITVVAGGESFSEPIRITSPTGEAEVIVGDVLYLRWETDESLVNNVYFTLSADGIDPLPILGANSITNEDPGWGEYAWTVPATLLAFDEDGMPVPVPLAGRTWVLEAIDYNDTYVIPMAGTLTIKENTSTGGTRTLATGREQWSLRPGRVRGTLELGIATTGSWSVRILSLNGEVLAGAAGAGVGVTRLNVGAMASGAVLVDLNVGGRGYHRTFILP